MSTPSDEEKRLLADATYACNTGHLREAFAIFERFAELGNIEALCGLSQMYLRGEGVAIDVEKGLAFLRRAAEMGHANSAFNLGALHRTGDCSVPKDPQKSKHYFQLAKELGCEISVEKFLD
jgi:TPR repeat protein